MQNLRPTPYLNMACANSMKSMVQTRCKMCFDTNTMKITTCKYKHDAKHKVWEQIRCKNIYKRDAKLSWLKNTKQQTQVCTNSTQTQGLDANIWHYESDANTNWERAMVMISVAPSCRRLRIRHSRHLWGRRGAKPHWCLHNPPRRHTGRLCWNCCPDSSAPLLAQ